MSSYKVQDGRHSFEVSATQLQMLFDKFEQDPKLAAQVRATFGIKSDDTENPSPKVTSAPTTQQVVTSSAPQDLNSGKVTQEDTTPQDVNAHKAIRPTAAADMLSLVKDFTLPRRIKFVENGYTPDASALFNVLHEMDKVIVKNFQARRNCLSLNPFINKVYFSFLFSLQVARCMHYDHRLDNDADETALTNFLASFPPEKLAIPGPLLPFFKSITTYKVQNALHRRVCPVFPEYQITGTYNPVAGNYCAQAFPTFPLVIAVIAKIYSQLGPFDKSKSIDTNLGFKDKTNPRSAFPFEYKDKDDHSKGYKSLKLAGHEYKDAPDTWNSNERQNIANPALRYWPALNPDLLDNIKTYGCDVVLPNVDDDLVSDSLAKFLCIEKRKWFKTLLEPMSEYSTLWTGSGSLADCSPDGPAVGAYVYNYSKSETAPVAPSAAFDPKAHFDLNGTVWTAQGTPEPVTERMAVISQIHTRPANDHPGKATYTSAHRRFGTVWNNQSVYGPSNEDSTYDSFSESVTRFINPALLKLARD